MDKAMLAVDQKLSHGSIFDFANFNVYSVPVTTPACKERSARFGVHGAMIHTLPCKYYNSFLGRSMTVVYC